MPTTADSDDETSERPRDVSLRSKRSTLAERDANSWAAASEGNGEPPVAVKNKGFTCCIQQYGVKVHEDDELKANAGGGKRWQRMYGLFGTMIN